MKKTCISAILLALCITVAACGTSRSEPPGTPPDDPVRVPDTEPTEEKPVRRIKDGFNPETNSEFEIGGINFYIPSYYLENKMSSGDTYTSFYAETTDIALAQLYFLVDTMSSDAVSLITPDLFYRVVDSEMLKLITTYNLEQPTTEEITVSGLPGKSISFRGDLPDTDDENITYPSFFRYVYIFDQDAATIITIELRQTDSTEFDYSQDFDKIIETAEKPGSSKDVTPTDGIRPEFKEAMDSYEAFFDEYTEFMVKYQSSNNPASMALEYLSFMTRYTETMEKLEAIDEKDLSPAESAYYVEVTARVSQKMLLATAS